MAQNNQYLKVIRRSVEAILPHNGQVLSRSQIIKLKNVPETLIKRGWAVKVDVGKFQINIPEGVDVDIFVENRERDWIDSARVSPWRKNNRLMYPKHNFKIAKMGG